MFYAIPTASFIFMAKISLDAFNLRLEDFGPIQFWVIMCEMKGVTESGQEGIKT